jgi:hypothetical protein
MQIAVNCILMLSAVFWSALWAVTTVTVVLGTFAPAETRTRRMCTCLYTFTPACTPVLSRPTSRARTHTWTESLPYQCTTKIICVQVVFHSIP